MELKNLTGWRASPPSMNDWNYPLSSIGMDSAMIPDEADVTQWVSRVDNQGNKPRCVSYGTTNAVEFQMKSHGLPVPKRGFSKAWLYEMCKRYDGIPMEDGTFVKTALWVALTYGLCPEDLCPTENYMNGEPVIITEEMMRAAAQYQIAGFSKLQRPDGTVSLDQIKQVIAKGGFVIIASIVDMEWGDEDPYLLRIEGEQLGGHCTMLGKYSNNKVVQTCKGILRDINSWGPDWADGGMADMSYDYAAARYPDGTPVLLEAWAFSVKAPAKQSCYVCSWLKKLWKR